MLGPEIDTAGPVVNIRCMAFCCTRDSLNRNLDIVTSNRRCRYHRTSRQMQLSLLAPRGMCPEAFHALFPDAFAHFTMPDELHDEQRSFVCPAGEVSFQIVRRPFRQLRHLPEQIVRRLASAFISCEVLKWRIFLRVSATGSCPFGQEVGEEFEINIGNREELCPAGGPHLLSVHDLVGTLAGYSVPRRVLPGPHHQRLWRGRRGRRPAL